MLSLYGRWHQSQILKLYLFLSCRIVDVSLILMFLIYLFILVQQTCSRVDM